MADKALILNENTGEFVEVYANDLTEVDKKNRYFCCGRPRDNLDGPVCMAELDLVTVKGRTNYFASLSNKSHHQVLCEYDESEEARKIGFLDTLGRSTSLEELFETFNRPQEEEKGGDPPDDGGGDKAPGGDAIDDEEDNIRPIVRVPIDPRAMKALLELLSHKGPDELYAGERVKTFFLNREGIREFRIRGLADGNVKIAILEKVSMKRIKQNYNLDFSGIGDIKRVVLVDAFSFDQKEQEQIFILSTKAYKKIYAADRDSLVCVLAKWRAHPRYPNVYISIGNLEDGCIEIINKGV